MKRRLFITSLGSGLLAFRSVAFAQQDLQTKGQVEKPDSERDDVATWYGDDRRFYHRPGGRRDGEHSWLDPFAAPNQNFAVCDTNGNLTLNRGSYRVRWDAEVIFRNPVCRSPSRDYPVLLSRVIGDEVNGTIVQTWHSQVYVCAHRDGLVYRNGITTNFTVAARSVVDISLVAFNDERTADSTDINAREVIVNEMVVMTRSRDVTDEELTTVHPISRGE